MRYALLLIALLCWPLGANAQYVKPDGGTVGAVPDYGVTVGVWVENAAFGIGTFIAVFEKQPSGQWLSCAGCGTSPDQNFEATVKAAGGPEKWLATVGVPFINGVLAKRYPVIGTPPTLPSDARGQANYYLGQGYTLKMVNGVPVLGK